MISANAAWWIMLTQALGYNNPKLKRLAESYSDISQFIKRGDREWRVSGILSALEIDKLAAAKQSSAQKVIDRCRQLNYSILTLDDKDYPSRLYHIYAPPAVLYISGSMPDFNNRLSIGIVGTRSASRYGTTNSYKIAYALAKYDTIIVSGGALGVDCASHRGALAAKGTTVCVRGCGINSRYLRDNESMRQAITVNGAVISEYPPDEEPRKYYFPARNRIIAALSDGVLVIEAGVKSGALITADLALDMGKDLFVLLGNNSPNNEGSNNRIKEGTAVPVTDFMDILANYENDSLSDHRVDFNDILNSDITAIPVKGKMAPSGDELFPDTVYTMPKTQKQVKREFKPKKEPRQKAQAAAAENPAPARRDVNLKGDAKRVYEYLSSQPVHIDTIADDLGLPVNRVLSTLTLLEVQGLARALQGRNFVLK